MHPAEEQPKLQSQYGIPQCIAKWLAIRRTTNRKKELITQRSSSPTPRTSDSRLLSSIADKPLELSQLPRSVLDHPTTSQTVLYLGYGSNMCAETFRGRRNIRPLSEVNVVVPELRLTFDLPGVPYSEPCFGNVEYRKISGSETQEKQSLLAEPPHFHKDNWKKGLVGIVYEVTLADFAHIIATEGGGASYQDVLVDCYTLSGDPTEEVPSVPTGSPFKAHTLFSPSSVVRPIRSYAQPSPRYLKLVTDGAEEHGLPYEYQRFLGDIGTYKITTTRQQLGQFIFLSIWAPIFAFLFGGASMFLDENGRYPEWYARFAMAAFGACWGSYDDFFKKTFGDGERTIEKSGGGSSAVNEKAMLVDQGSSKYGTCDV